MDPNNKPLAVKILGVSLRALGLIAPKRVGRIYASLAQKPEHNPLRPSDALLFANSTKLETATNITAWSFGPDNDATDHNRPTALLVHGWSFRGAHMGKFVQPLLEAGYRVVIVDLPAHGESKGQRTSPVQTTAELGKFVSELGAIDTVIAHSFGGLCSMRLAFAGWNIRQAVTIACPKVYIFEEAADYIGAQGRARQAMFNDMADFDGGQPADTANLYEQGEVHWRWLQLHSTDDAIVSFEKHGQYLADHYDMTLQPMQSLGHTKILWADETIRATMDFLQQS